MTESMNTSLSRPAALWVAAGDDCFGEQQGLGNGDLASV